MKKKNCPDCKQLVKEWNKQCKDCGYTLVLEPEEEVRARYLRGPALGALLWTQGWAIGGRTYLWFLLSLVPVIGIVSLIFLTLFGRRISWERGGWSSWEEYKSRMRMMDIIGLVWIGTLIVIYLVVRQ